MAVQIPAGRPLTQGKEIPIIEEAVTSAGVTEQTIVIDADTVLISVQATQVTGSLVIEAFTETAEGQSVSVLTFPTITAPTTELLLREPTTSQVMQRLRIRATYTGACTFKIRARGLGRGQSNIRIQGNDSWRASQIDVGTSPTLVIPAGLTDRQGLVVRNWSSTITIYVGASAAEATVANGYPIDAKAALGLDLQAGAAVYAVADSGTADIRLLEAGF